MGAGTSTLTATDFMPINASASGKAIIVGEHAVVYGAKAVAMPVVSMRMGVKLTRQPQHTGEAPKFKVMLGGRSVSDHLAGVVDEAFQALDVAPFSLSLEGTSSVLIGAGLGSSASLCIVVLRAIATATGKSVTPSMLSRLGNRLEKRFHGNPSGLDTAAVALEQVIAFVKDEGAETVTLSPIKSRDGQARGWRFVLLDSGARSSTLAMIQAAAPYFQGSLGKERILRFNNLADIAISGLGNGDAEGVAIAMNEASILLTEAGVVGDPLSSLIATARNVGVLAAKSTGAGGGGCVLALLDPSAADAQLAELRQRLGANKVYEVSL